MEEMNRFTDFSHPQFFAWRSPVRDKSTSEIKQHWEDYKAKGMTGVFLDSYHEANIEILNEVGLDVHIWMWTTNRRDAWIRENHPDWFMVSRSGKSCFDQPPYVDYYRWVSPVIPGVQTFLKEQVDEICRHPGVKGVHLDYVRYPDVILPDSLWKTYGVDQTEELADFDFCYSEHTRKAFKDRSGIDPLDIKSPDLHQEWLKFRYDSVTHLVNQLVEVGHGAGKQVTAAVFPTPSLARKICRQDWDKWPLDAFCPMIYHSFYNQKVNWIGDCVREDIQATLAPVIAGLYMPAFTTIEEFRTALELVRRRGGKGVSLFGDVKAEYWEVFSESIWS